MGIYKAYDIRGIYGLELKEIDSYLFAYYFAKKYNVKEIKIANDCRNSRETLSKFLIEGFLDANCKVEYLGLSSTVNFYFSLFEGINSGIMITASHNSKEYNGFKIILNGKSFDGRNGLEKMEETILEDKDNKIRDFEQVKNQINAYSLKEFLDIKEIETKSKLNLYIDYLRKLIHLKLHSNEIEILKKNIIGLDFSSGMSSLALKKTLELEGFNIVSYNFIPDGNFPNHEPEPREAEEFVKNIKENFSFLAAFDGDGDRIGFYDENKKLIPLDYIICKYIEYFSEGHKNFICDLRISKIAIELAKNKKLKLNLMKVGRAYYKDYLDENLGVFGAELSGHLFFESFNNYDNPDVALIFMMKIYAENLLKKNDLKFSELFKKYEKYTKFPETNLKVQDGEKILETFKKMYEKNIVMDIDGLSFDFKSYWFNIRKSNTENLIRLTFEGKDDSTIKEFDNIVNKIKNI